MIQNVSQIEKEFLIKTIVQNEQPVRFHGVSTAGTGLITTLERTEMCATLLDTLDDSCFAIFEHVTCYFDCHGKTYAFESTIRDSTQKSLRLDPPLQLLRSLQRKYIRVKKPKDINVVFHLDHEDIRLDYPVCPEYISVENCAKESEFSGKSFPELVASFKQEVSTRCTNSTIIMFRNKKADLFEEQLISKTGKVLFIPSTGSVLPKKDPYPEGRIITEELEETFEDPNFFIEGTKLSKIMAAKKRTGVSSEIWCPIVYFQYVVGYIYVADHTGEAFDISMVDYLWDFSRILAFQLRQTGYFKLETGTAIDPGHKARVIDMSPGGMLLSIPRSEIRTPIREGSVFGVDISLGKKGVSCSARVIRRYEETDEISYGTSFLNLSPSDVMNLYEFLYRRPFNENDPIAYEQL